jgi:ABC-type dipeptide/oligopeptide/nickel transport system ATPase subunit
MDKLGLSKELLKRSVVNLSGGEQRRVALIRALAVKPKILVLDEVTSGLDKESKMKVMDLLKTYRLNFQCSILLITHDCEVAYELSDKLLLLENGKITKKAERIKK